ncbi:hypothetical protein ACHAWF_013938 [Thalassiosira exigua]
MAPSAASASPTRWPALLLALALALGRAGAFSPASRAPRVDAATARARRSAAATALRAEGAAPSHRGGSLPPLPSVKAAVIVPGFLTGEDEFAPLAASLTAMGVPSVVVPMPNWHWLPCLGGRSMRPMLERIDFAVRHLAAVAPEVAGGLGDYEALTKESLERSLEETSIRTEEKADQGREKERKDPQILIPKFSYNLLDLYADFRNNPGGVFEVGGSAEVDDYPLWTPRGSFPAAPEPAGRVALIGHSAGGWICRAYLSDRDYGGKVYRGTEVVHSLITLGSPHGNAPGPAFKGVEWVNREILDASGGDGVRALAVGGTGYKGDSSGQLTQNAYAFCCPRGSDGTTYDGDGVTPIESALAMKECMPHADTLVLDDVGHFCWSDVFGGEQLAPGEFSLSYLSNNIRPLTSSTYFVPEPSALPSRRSDEVSPRRAAMVRRRTHHRKVGGMVVIFEIRLVGRGEGSPRLRVERWHQHGTIRFGEDLDAPFGRVSSEAHQHIRHRSRTVHRGIEITRQAKAVFKEEPLLGT